MNPFASLKRIFHDCESHAAIDDLMKAADDLQEEFSRTVTYVRQQKECDRREREVTPIIERRRARG